MTEYLHLFETNSARTSYEDGNDYVEPYVSYVEENDSTYYNNPRKALFKLKNGSVAIVYGEGELTS